MDQIVLVAVLGAVATVASAYFVFRLGQRNTAGNIDTSTAANLWDESTKIRLELRGELGSTRGQLAGVRERLDEAIAAIAALHETLRTAEEASLTKILVLTTEVSMLRALTVSMHEEVTTSNALTIGALADNIETRRILAIPQGDRTPMEREHLATADQRLPDTLRAHTPEAD